MTQVDVFGVASSWTPSAQSSWPHFTCTYWINTKKPPTYFELYTVEITFFIHYPGWSHTFTFRARRAGNVQASRLQGNRGLRALIHTVDPLIPSPPFSQPKGCACVCVGCTPAEKEIYTKCIHIETHSYAFLQSCGPNILLAMCKG